jgi:hypothetical protein
MNDGTQSVGMAGVLTVQGRQAKYKIFRARSLTTEEKTLAAKLGQIPETKEEAAAPKKEEAPKK